MSQLNAEAHYVQIRSAFVTGSSANRSVPSVATPVERSSKAEAETTDQSLILVVEDDVGMSTMLAIALEDAGYNVHVAAHGGEALDMLQQIEPRLILLDLRMPIMDGLTFYHTARARHGTDLPPIIVMTAYRDVDPEVIELGLPSINKPMKLDVLIRMIREHI